MLLVAIEDWFEEEVFGEQSQIETRVAKVDEKDKDQREDGFN